VNANGFVRFWPPFLDPHKSSANGISIGSAVFAGLTNRQKDHATPVFMSVHSHVSTRSAAIAERPARRSISWNVVLYYYTNNANRSPVSLRSTFSNCRVLFRYLNSFYFCTQIVALGTTIAQRACNRPMPCVSSTDFRITNLVDVNWTLTVINQRRLPPVLLTTPHITPTLHHHRREPPRMDTKVSNSKSDLQGHWRSLVMVPFDMPHTISYFSRQLQLYVYLAPLPRYYHLFPKI